jgi:predicted nuclease of predicted toxin-antitoxin system
LKFPIDNALSPGVAAGLRQLGHDAVHVRELGVHSASDSTLLELAAKDNRVLVSTDADFTVLLAARKARKPSLFFEAQVSSARRAASPASGREFLADFGVV